MHHGHETTSLLGGSQQSSSEKVSRVLVGLVSFLQLKVKIFRQGIEAEQPRFLERGLQLEREVFWRPLEVRI